MNKIAEIGPPVVVTPEILRADEPSKIDQATEDTSEAIADILNLYDEHFDLKGCLKEGFKTFKEQGEVALEWHLGNASAGRVGIRLTNAEKECYRPVIVFVVDGQDRGQYAFGGRYQASLKRALAGLPVEAPAAKKEESVPESLIEIEVHRSVPNYKALEVVLHQEPHTELYLVSGNPAGSDKIYRILANPVKGFKVYVFNLKTKSWASTGQALSLLKNIEASGFSFLDEKTLEVLTNQSPATIFKPVLKALKAEDNNSAETDTEMKLLAPAEIASLFSQTENLPHWTAVFEAITQKKPATSLESCGVKMRINSNDSGDTATLSFEVAGEDSSLWNAMKAEKKTFLQDPQNKDVLVTFLKEYGVKGFGFKSTKITNPEADEGSAAGTDSESEGDSMSRQDMMNLMGGMGGATAGEDLAPENKEDHEAQAVEAFIDKFNAEVLRDIKGQILRIDNSEATKILMEKLFLEAEDLVIESCEGLVEIDFSATGIKKVKFWLGAGLRKGPAIREKWYIFKANLEATLNEISSGEVEIDVIKFQSVLDEDDDRL